MNFPIETYDTKLASQDLFDKVMYLPYMYTRTDDPPCKARPEVDISNNYWTHQLYNFTPVEDPEYFDNSGLEGSNNPLYLEILEYLEAVCPKMPKRDWLYSAYINCLKAGDTPGVHVDAPYWIEENRTVLLYLNPEWNPNYGGETIFYDHRLEAQRIVSPIPGRVVIFDGRVPHSGRPPTNRYPINRYIISFKYMDPVKRQSLFNSAEMDNKHGLMPPEDLGVIGFDSKTIEKLLLT